MMSNVSSDLRKLFLIDPSASLMFSIGFTQSLYEVKDISKSMISRRYIEVLSIIFDEYRQSMCLISL